MQAMTTSASLRKGGSWLLEDTTPSDVFTPERLTDEHRLMAQTTAEFMETEVLPNLEFPYSGHSRDPVRF